MSEELEQNNDGTWSGLKKTIIGVATTAVMGLGTWGVTQITGGDEAAPAAAAPVINITNSNQQTQQQAAGGNTTIIKERVVETSQNYSRRSYDFSFISYFQKYKFKNFDFIKNIEIIDDFLKCTIKLDDILSFLPNIFINNYDSILYTFYQKTINTSDLIFIYIDKVKKFILIPKYMVIYFYDDFVMYDSDFKVINEHKINLCDTEQEKILENNIFVKILSNNYTSEEFDDFSSNIQIKNNYYLYLLILYFRIIVKKLDNNLVIKLYELNQVFIHQNLSLHFNPPSLDDKYNK